MNYRETSCRPTPRLPQPTSDKDKQYDAQYPPNHNQYQIQSMIRNIIKAFPIRLLKRPQYGIIFNLFKKKNEADAQAQIKAKSQPKPEQKEMQDEQYDFFERRKEIDTGIDFSKLRELNTTYIPEDIGKGGIEEVIYWSQNVNTPEQIQQILIAFNLIAERQNTKAYLGNPQLQQFKINVVNSVYLIDSLNLLHQYTLFALRYDIRNGEFWQKIEFKCMKYTPSDQKDISSLVDIAFIMGQFNVGEQIFNFVQKMLAQQVLNIDHNIKLFMLFSTQKKGEKQWIQKLLNGINQTVHEANAEQLTGVLQSLKEAKKLPEALNLSIQKRALQLISQMNLTQLLNLSVYFGFEHENDQFWSKLQARGDQLLQNSKIGSRTLESLIYKAMLTYRLSTSFIRKYIIQPVLKEDCAVLHRLKPRTLSALSKGLYIYELQLQSKSIEEEVGKLLIGRISEQINDISDEDLIKIIQDYNLTRHGNRQIYIFFEEVVKIKYIRHYNPELDRNTIELLIQIYENSGMCSKEMLASLRNLILEE